MPVGCGGAAPLYNERARGSLEAFGDWVVWVVGVREDHLGCGGREPLSHVVAETIAHPEWWAGRKQPLAAGHPGPANSCRSVSERELACLPHPAFPLTRAILGRRGCEV